MAGQWRLSGPSRIVATNAAGVAPLSSSQRESTHVVSELVLKQALQPTNFKRPQVVSTIVPLLQLLEVLGSSTSPP